MPRRRVFLCVLAIIIVQMVARPALGQAAQWANLATVSNSTSLQAGSLCATDGRDIYCDNSVGSITGLGVADLFSLTHVSASIASGNLYIGDVSGSSYATTQNTAIGIQALSNNTTGINNLAVGYAAMSSNTTGRWNTAMGRMAMLQNKTGEYNTAVGAKALYLNGSGSDNVAIGTDAMGQPESAALSVAVGRAALNRATVVTYTTALGYRAGFSYPGPAYHEGSTYIGSLSAYNLLNSASNTLVGYRAGYSLVSGAGNIALGAGAELFSTTGSYQLNIGNVIYGDIGRGRDSRIGINVTSPSAHLEVSGTVSATDIKLSRNATLPAANCTSAADEGRIIMAADGPYVCQLR